MFDHVQLGWLGGDDYRAAAEAAGVVELPGGTEPDGPAGESAEGLPPWPPRDGPCSTGVLDDLLTRPWTDDDPGSVGK